MSNARGNRRSVQGVVTSDKMDKTITVRVERLVKVPKYGKFIRRHTVCHAHDEHGEARVGDQVELMEARRLSKTKCWRLVRVLRRSKAVDTRPAESAQPDATAPSTATAE